MSGYLDPHEGRVVVLYGTTYRWSKATGSWKLGRESVAEARARQVASWESVLREQLAVHGRVAIDELLPPVPAEDGRAELVGALALAARNLLRAGEATLEPTGGVLVAA